LDLIPTAICRPKEPHATLTNLLDVAISACFDGPAFDGPFLENAISRTEPSILKIGGETLVRMSVVLLGLAVVGVVALRPIQIRADVIPPSGLAPGSPYELMFVTAATTTAVSSNIADYNAFVQAQAALSPTLPSGATWQAVASTATVSANVNAPSTGEYPIYNTRGQLVAPAGTSLYSAAYQASFSGIFDDQYGNIPPGNSVYVWTGSTASGDPYPSRPLGSDDPILGYTDAGNSITLAFSVGANTYEAHLYGLSGPIIYAAAPEPATLTMLGTGFLAFGGWPLLRRRRSTAK
jgi:hypothetical protein